MTDFAGRRKRLQASLRERGAEAMLVTHATNVTYLTGFTGDDSYLLLSPQGALLLSDPRYDQQIGEECPGLEALIRKPTELLLKVTCATLRKLSLPNLLIEGEHVSVNLFDHLQAESGIPELIKGHGQVEALRMLKDATEIALLRRAVSIAERAFTSIRAQLSGKQTERELAHELDRLVRKMGGSGCSFKPIVAVGARAALPHAVPGESTLDSSPFVLIDWGATLGGYRSDLTRVLVTSKIPAKFARIYETVLTAQQAAIDALRPGVLVSEIDRIARESIASAGMGKRFTHGLGHGIGLDIHEAPRLGKNEDRPLESGMVVTVEPGVYYPGFGGVRIEDDVLITDRGCEVLSSLPRELEANQVELLDGP
ncbi:M24 family metallopeptidase [Aureliella helgolandensis]|nr:aminopeptidase P family protein [Aureliella helgolandensis]